MPSARIGLDEAVGLTRTGDLWLFRGHTAADRAIQLATNSPVNHVGMSVVLDDLPPLMWHAELGRSLPDLWSGSRHRGAQLHDLRAAVTVWATRYGQRAWLRQLEPAPGRGDGGCAAAHHRAAGRHPVPVRDPARLRVAARAGLPSGRLPGELRGPDAEAVWRRPTARRSWPSPTRPWACWTAVPTSWYDPGRFWSGDDLRLLGEARLSGEIAVQIPATQPSAAS